MISIIIPTFGDQVRVSKLITSIRKFEKDASYELIVINDNPSKMIKVDGGIVLQNTKNKGFAASINWGLKEAKGNILLLLNDDIVFNQPVLYNLPLHFVDDKLGVLGATLFYPNKSVQHAGMYFDHKTKSFHHIKVHPKEPKYMIAVTGAFFAISRKLYEAQGGLDERFFLACEDTKYCLDAWKRSFKVKLSKDVRAIHEEGATRGRTPQEKRKHLKWTTEEAKGIREFKATLDLSQIKAAEKEVRKLNGEQIKIEVGSGYNPQPGYKHLDIRKGLPQLDYVCDFVSQPLPFNDGEVSEILANHVIEHIPFRKLPFVVGEWARVLEEGGRLTLRTPNLRFICEKYLKGETTPEWPGDEKFIKENLSAEVTPAWWTNLKLFSGQDYAANFHHVCFDFDMLAALLGRFGFGVVEQGKFDREYSPGELQVVAYKEPRTLDEIFKDVDPALGAKATHRGPMPVYPKKSCLVIRDGAMGDVILTTPIIERLAKDYLVTVETKCLDVFGRNRDAIGGQHPEFKLKKKHEEFDRILDLNLAYENRPKMHIIDAYSMEAFGDTKTPHICKLYEEKKPKGDWIVIHASRSWENRTWPFKSWAKLCDLLAKDGQLFTFVGKWGHDHAPTGEHFFWSPPDKDQTFWELVDTISTAKLFVGMDSGPLHIAQAVGTKSVGIFTCAQPKFRWHSLFTNAYVSPINCVGCLHLEKPPVTYCGCPEQKDFECIKLIEPEAIFEKIMEILYETPNDSNDAVNRA